MVATKKGVLTYRLTFSWVILCMGYFSISTVNASAVVKIHSKPNGRSPSSVVKSHEKSVKGCAEACAKETRITCNFFKYLRNTGTCYMSPIAQKDMRESVGKSSLLVHHDKNMAGKKMSYWIKNMDEKLTELDEQEANIEELKNAVADLRHELNVVQKMRSSDVRHARINKEALRSIFQQLTRRMVGLKTDGQKFKNAVHALSSMQKLMVEEIGGLKEDQKDVVQKVTELEKTAGHLNNLLTSLKATDNALQREMDHVKDISNSMSSAFNQLRNKINQELNNKEMPPAMVKLKHNQGTLATALENLMDKVSGLVGRLPFLEGELRTTNQKITKQTVHDSETENNFKILYKDLSSVKSAVRAIQDPRSTQNMKRARELMKLKSEVSMLEGMDKGLKTDVQDQREELVRLVHEVAHAQVLAQNFRERMNQVVTFNRQVRQDIAFLKRKEKDSMSWVKVAEMQKQVMTALSRLKTREALLLKDLKQYRTAVKKLATQVTQSADTRNHTEEAVEMLEHRLSNFEKQIQLLFDKARDMTAKMIKPQPALNKVNNLVRTQSETSNRVEDLLKQLQSIRRKVSVLSMDLRQTKKEAELDKIAMAKDIQAREEEMQKRQKEIKEQTLREKEEERKALEFKKKQMEKQQRAEKKKMQHEVEKEKRKRKMEEKARHEAENEKRKQGDTEVTVVKTENKVISSHEEGKPQTAKQKVKQETHVRKKSKKLETHETLPQTAKSPRKPMKKKQRPKQKQQKIVIKKQKNPRKTVVSRKKRIRKPGRKALKSRGKGVKRKNSRHKSNQKGGKGRQPIKRKHLLIHTGKKTKQMETEKLQSAKSSRKPTKKKQRPKKKKEKLVIKKQKKRINSKGNARRKTVASRKGLKTRNKGVKRKNSRHKGNRKGGKGRQPYKRKHFLIHTGKKNRLSKTRKGGGKRRQQHKGKHLLIHTAKKNRSPKRGGKRGQHKRKRGRRHRKKRKRG